MAKIFVFLIFILLSVNCLSQSHWRIRNENGEELLLTISVNSGNQTFNAHSRKEALREMAGSFTYMLAKTAGKIRYPEIIHSEGKVTFIADTTFYNGSFDYLDKSFPLIAKSWKNNFAGTLTDNRNRTHPLIGTKEITDQPLRDYAKLISTAFSLTEKYYWDHNLAKSSDWVLFKNKIDELKSKIADDYELGATLFWLSKKLPLTPYEIKKISPKENDPKPERIYSAREVKSKVALLDLSDLPSEKEKMDQLFRDIQKKEFSVLILDARGRKNLRLGTAALLGDHLTPMPADWGIYLTRKWLDSNVASPKLPEYAQKFKNAILLSANNQDLYLEPGRYMKPVPATIVFKGKIYVLTDQKTSRVAEALAIWLKNDKVATLVGQKSAGQPMLFEVINVDSQYRITIPTAQFFDKLGNNRYGSGLDPDILSDEDALSALLKKL
ncbi:MAG: S41 family peptidase [Prolixibacteraceae bacterium]